MTEEEYKQEWLNGMHQTEYNACRFSNNKIQYCFDWLNKNVPDWNTRTDIVKDVCAQKLKIASNKAYQKKCQDWADKLTAYYKAQKILGNRYVLPTYEIENIAEAGTFLGTKDNIIVKCNHGSGWNRLINLHQPYGESEKKLNEWITLNYAYMTGYEAQYENIKPTLIAQREFISHPLDWGFWCINGEIQGISLTKKLGKNLEEYIGFVDEHGKYNSWYIGSEPQMRNLPKSWDYQLEGLKEIAKTLSKGFDFVRVDLYCYQKEFYFGEMTFTPCSGKLNCITL